MSSTQSAETEALSLEDALVIFTEFAGEPNDIVLVGGQAVSFWSRYYKIHLREPTTSSDVDFLGLIRNLDSFAKKYQGKARRPGEDHVNTPELAVVLGSLNGKPVKIDFLGSILGISNADVLRRASNITYPNASFRVMHPAHVLLARLAIVSGVLRRTDTMALRQMTAAVQIAEAWIDSETKRSPRSGLNAREEVFEIACRPMARKLAQEFGIEMFAAVKPAPGLPAAFGETRYPQMQAEIARLNERLERHTGTKPDSGMAP
jgi:hypothetical protein